RFHVAMQQATRFLKIGEEQRTVLAQYVEHALRFAAQLLLARAARDVAPVLQVRARDERDRRVAHRRRVATIALAWQGRRVQPRPDEAARVAELVQQVGAI